MLKLFNTILMAALFILLKCVNSVAGHFNELNSMYDRVFKRSDCWIWFIFHTVVPNELDSNKFWYWANLMTGTALMKICQRKTLTKTTMSSPAKVSFIRMLSLKKTKSQISKKKLNLFCRSFIRRWNCSLRNFVQIQQFMVCAILPNEEDTGAKGIPNEAQFG